MKKKFSEKLKLWLRSDLRPHYPSVMVVGLAAVYGLISHLAFSDWLWNDDLFAILTCSFLFLMPFGLGALTVHFANKENQLSVSYAIMMPWVSCAVFVGLLVILALEAAICIVLASPVLLVMSSLGGLVMWSIKSRRKGLQNFALIFILGSPYMVTPFEVQVETNTKTTITHTQIHVAADAAAVWEEIKTVPAISEQEHSWNFFHTVGLPRPVSAELSYDGIGGQRDARFEDGLTFVETITAWDEHQKISFTIEATSQELLPAPLSMIGSEQFDVLEGTYVIEPLEDGTVNLHLYSEHILNTRFNEYGAVWTNLIMNDLQSYILQIVKARAEESVIMKDEL